MPSEEAHTIPEDSAVGDDSRHLTSRTVLDENTEGLTPGNASLQGQRSAAYFRRHSIQQGGSNHVEMDGDFVFRVDGSAAIANPAPLGLISFAMTTLFLSFLNVGILDDGFVPYIFAYAFVLGGVTQMIAGILEFFKKNTFGGVAFTLFGAFWVGLALEFWIDTPLGALPSNKGMALFFSLWTILVFFLWLLTLKISVALSFTFFTLDIAFGLLAASKGVPTNGTIVTAAGAFGIIAGFAAMYTGYATLTNEILQREFLPIGSFPEIWRKRAEAKGKVSKA